jgi:hypothetical protein
VLWSSHPGRALNRIRAAGARGFRLYLSWSAIAPDGPQAPRGFDAANPADPRYRWRETDRMLKQIVDHGLEPIICISDAPAWAEDQQISGRSGTRRPDPAALAEFATAIAIRYGGYFGGLPRVRYWQIWNEPNLPDYLNPQVLDGRPVAPALYRRMLNAAAAAIRRVQPDAAVIAGATAPFGAWPKQIPPLTFMQELLCMKGDSRPKPTCPARVKFDVWSHHPYTLGSPDRHGPGIGDVSLADLPAMRVVLRAATRAGHVVATHRPRFWVTEFGWDSNPPDPAAVPERLEARWVAEALYRMWRSGVSLVTWYQLRDEPIGSSFSQTGLYFDDGPDYRLDRPKLALTAFRFPFVAYPRRHGVYVWGRAPDASKRRVIIEREAGAGWRRLGIVRTDRSGVFSRWFRAAGPAASLRARLRRHDASLPFSLKKPPELALANPFGS